MNSSTPSSGAGVELSDVEVKAWEDRDDAFCLGLYEQGLLKLMWDKGVSG